MKNSDKLEFLEQRVSKMESTIREKGLFPFLTTNPLLTLFCDKFGNKMYKEKGHIVEIKNNSILFIDKLYERIKIKNPEEIT